MKRHWSIVLAGILLEAPMLSEAVGAALDTHTLASVEAFSGHMAILPAPGFRDIQDSPTGRTLAAGGLAPHLALLTPDQFANPNFFNARRFPLALYLGFESYFQTVKAVNDGDTALRNYVGGGGTLLVLPSGPFPLYYNQAGQPANGAAVIGLQIGAGSFERPPAGLSLTFHVNTNQSAIQWPARKFPFPSPLAADQRWRPSRAPGGPGADYSPWVTLLDNRGGNHGEGAALLSFKTGPLAGGRVLYVWCSLLADECARPTLISDLLKWALNDIASPKTTQLRDAFESRPQVSDEHAYWFVQTGQWKLDAGTLVGENCIADGYETQGAARGNVYWRDYELSVRFQIESRGSDWRDGPWIGVRVRPDGDGYYLTFTDRNCQLHKVIYGIFTREANALATAPWHVDDQWHRLNVFAHANHLKAVLDDRQLFEVKDDAHLNYPSIRSGGIVLAARKGSRSKGNTVVRFDDFEIKFLE